MRQFIGLMMDVPVEYVLFVRNDLEFWNPFEHILKVLIKLNTLLNGVVNGVARQRQFAYGGDEEPANEVNALIVVDELLFKEILSLHPIHSEHLD
jgi:hypothetical protein